MSDHPRPTRFSRLLARCYPRELREQYADDIARFIDDQRRDSRFQDSRLRLLLMLGGLIVDALASLLAAWRNDSPHMIRRPNSSLQPTTFSRKLTMDAIFQDLRFALRGFIRRPAFTLVAISTLALGIGANSAIFTLVNAVLLRPLPFPHPTQLVMIEGVSEQNRGLQMSIPDLEDMRQRNRTFDEIGMVRAQSVNLTGLERPDRVYGAFVSASTLRVFGAKTAVGRLFSDEETAIGAGALVTVLTHRTWQTRFGARPDIVGQSLILNGRPHVVVGVTSADYADPYTDDLWLPITSAPSRGWFGRANATVFAVGRLKAGRTAQDGEKDLQAIAQQLAGEHPASNAKLSVAVLDMHERMVRSSRFMLVLLFGAVAAVLLIVCVNIANLQLARASTRSKEMSVRAALGANRIRLMSQVITESLLLSLVGGALGLLLGQWGVRLLVAAVPDQLPYYMTLVLDTRVVLFSLALALITGILFGAPAALLGTGQRVHDALRVRNENASTHRFSFRSTLVVAQLALCIVLLATAGLFARSLVALQHVPTGFNPEGVLTAEFRLPSVKYDDSTKVQIFMTRALEQLRAVPGVRSAALVDAVPLSGNQGNHTYVAEGQTEPVAGAAPTAQSTSVSDGYFRTMEIAQLAGRDFTTNDRPGTERVAIVNQTFAEVAWPGESMGQVLGKTVRLITPYALTVRVVGVVADVKYYTLSENLGPQLYLAKFQSSGIFSSVALRTTGNPEARADDLRKAIWSVDADQPVWKVRSLSAMVQRDLASTTLIVKLIGGFASLALLLGVIGVYGVMSFGVAQRTREVGIRMALGARSDQVLQLILRGGFSVVVSAIVIGMAGAVAAGRYLQSALFGVGAADPVTMIGAPLLLGTVAMIACWVPARRAARVDPAITLRSE